MVQLIPDKEMNHVVSHLPGVVRAVNETAKEGAGRAAAVLADHRSVPAHGGHARITVTRGGVDSFVNLDDTRGDRAAAAIEYGRSGGRGGATQGINALGSAF